MSSSNPNGDGKEVKAAEKQKDSKKEELKQKQARAEAKRQLRKAGKGVLLRALLRRDSRRVGHVPRRRLAACGF